VTSSSVLLFAMREGARTAIIAESAGWVGNCGGLCDRRRAWSGEAFVGELLDRIEAAPENFSPNVLLRPVVQDYLLPTLA